MGPGDLILRLGAAALLGSLIGLERQRLDRSAGLRTHMLVGLGSALVMIVSAYGFGGVLEAGRVVLDPSRVAAQVVSGIGFLGAGTIIVRQASVHGLTTAAGLWATAAIGLACGGALFLAAAVATGLMLVILAVVKPMEDRLFGRGHAERRTFRVAAEGPFPPESIATLCQEEGVEVEGFRLRDDSEAGGREVEVRLGPCSSATALRLAGRIQRSTGVREVSST